MVPACNTNVGAAAANVSGDNTELSRRAATVSRHGPGVSWDVVKYGAGCDARAASSEALDIGRNISNLFKASQLVNESVNGCNRESLKALSTSICVASTAAN